MRLPVVHLFEPLANRQEMLGAVVDAFLEEGDDLHIAGMTVRHQVC